MGEEYDETERVCVCVCSELTPQNNNSIFYVFHLMECDSYYDTHPPYTGPGDKCQVDAVAAGTAVQYSILGMSTTICGRGGHFSAHSPT